jgi:PAS domain S-box-containing protein
VTRFEPGRVSDDAFQTVPESSFPHAHLSRVKAALSIPATQAAHCWCPSPVSTLPISSTRAEAPAGPYVLLLEDSDRDAQLIMRALVSGGFDRRVERVQSREGFLRRLGESLPEVFISDHGLPAFDGFAALGIAQLRCPEVPFIFLSGAMAPVEVVRALREGARDVLGKDKLGSLVPTLVRVLGTRTGRPKIAAAASLSLAWKRAKAADKRLQLFVESLEQDRAFYVVDPDGRILAWNGAMTCLLGHSAAEMVGEAEERLFFGNNVRDGVPGGLRHDSDTDRHRGIRIRKNGTSCDVDATVTALRDEAGEIFGHVVILCDASAAPT